MSYKRVLAALDHSSLGEDVFAEALEIAESQKAELLLIFCLDRWEKTMPPVEAATGMGLQPMMRMYPSTTEVEMLQATQQEIETATKQAETWLSEYQTKAKNKGVNAQYKSIPSRGNPGQQICETAEEWNADLTVVGRKGRTGLEEAFLGSVSNHVVHHAPCSVLVVQHES
ncbi:MAG: universal stress protein [Cyanobacteriota bacterium]|nr:universal stress protein [Cyanobacteriota bacterium]